jgi:hypothetical protein
VNEVDKDGNVVHLQSTEVPKPKKKESDDASSGIVRLGFMTEPFAVPQSLMFAY